MKPVRWMVGLTLIASVSVAGLHYFHGSRMSDRGITNPSVAEAVPASNSSIESRRPVDDPGESTSTRDGRQIVAATTTVQDPFAALLFDSSDAGEALSRIALTFGDDSPQYAQARREFESACGGDPDPYATSEAGHVDVLRQWAVVALLDRCQSYARESAPPKALAISPGSIERREGRAAALAFAKSALHTEQDRWKLAEASTYLLEHGELDLPAIFGVSALGQADQFSALVHASTLVQCETASGCGAGSLPTLSYCRVQGCAAGSTYADALRQTQSARQFAATMSAYRWMSAQRRGG